GLPPDLPASIRPARITRVESLADGICVPVDGGGGFVTWREFAEPADGTKVMDRTGDGHPARLRRGEIDYLCGWPDTALRSRLLQAACDEAGIVTRALPDGVRMRRAGDRAFLVNYSDTPFDIASLGTDVRVLHGEARLAPSGFAIVTLHARS
ncbi:MAG: beta-galactosidase, partial [Pseudomonadota bacterium]|nr:beta-galactosidase [Pseudomonadota bacterium]